MSGLGGIRPQERDLSRRRDRQASVVFARTESWVALAIVCIGLLSVVLGLTDFDGGAFQG